MKLKINTFPVRIFITVLATLVTMILFFIIGIMIINYLDLEMKTFINGLNNLRARSYLIVMLISSFICASLLSFVLIRIQLKPYNLLKYGLFMLTKGEYSVRLDSKNLNSAEFNEIIEDFNTLAQELENTELFRKDFINNFSHEFKTPITSIKGFAKIIKNNHLTEEEKSEYLDIIVAESSRLAQLSNNILTLTKIENQGIITNEENYQLSEQIRLIILSLEPVWSKKGLNFDLDLADFMFFGNRELISHIWLNLIDNAIKFSPQNADISIKLMQETDQAVFKISDYGSGMDEETINQIFNKFYQGDASHNVCGNGIGMAIAKSVVDFYKGEIDIISQLNQGSSFTVKLPSEQTRS